MSIPLSEEGSVVTLQSILSCPHCGTQKAETMPTDACWFFYDCSGCGTLLKPKSGDCCVFCSYGDVPCPRSSRVAKARIAACNVVPRQHHIASESFAGPVTISAPATNDLLTGAPRTGPNAALHHPCSAAFPINSGHAFNIMRNVLTFAISVSFLAGSSSSVAQTRRQALRQRCICPGTGGEPDHSC
jgi:hypothetical protein